MFFILILIGLEINYQVQKRKADPFSDVMNCMTKEEFIQALKEGKKLVLLDDFILAKNFYKTAESSQLFISHVC